jgi:hypothetical protein
LTETKATAAQDKIRAAEEKMRRTKYRSLRVADYVYVTCYVAA